MEKIDFFEEMLKQRKDPSAKKKSYTNAEWVLANSYEWSRNNQSDVLIIRDVLWDGFPVEMSQILQKEGVHQLCLACPGANLLEWLSEFCRCGWTLKEMRQVPVSRFECQTLFAPGILIERK